MTIYIDTPKNTVSPAATVCCLSCGQAAAGGPVCESCLEDLKRVCYGKERLTSPVNHSRSHSFNPLTREHWVAYQCPVCLAKHNGRTSGLGELTMANATLTALRLRRAAEGYLAYLAVSYAPENGADRAAWRAELDATKAARRATAPNPSGVHDA